MLDLNNLAQWRQPDLKLANKVGRQSVLNKVDDARVKDLLVVIDPQKDFICLNGSLAIASATEALLNILKFAITRSEEIDGILVSMDEHELWQIFFQLWWQSPQGENPDFFSQILSDQYRFFPQRQVAWSKYYLDQLKLTGQEPLRIWPYHCLRGTEGAEIVAELAEMISYLHAARGIEVIFLRKGFVQESEAYGPFGCCVPVPGNPFSQRQDAMMAYLLKKFRRLYFTGFAEDYCVREALRQMLTFSHELDPQLAQKMYLLKDCTSLVYPQNRLEADNVLDRFSQLGLQVTESTSV